MLESVKIIEQGIENIPGGPVNVESTTDAVLPAKPPVYRSIEGLIQHFEVLMPNRGLRRAARGDLRGARNRPTASWAFTSSATARRGPTGRGRGRRRTSISRLFPHLIRGHQLSDVVAVLGSINIIAAELDR